MRRFTVQLIEQGVLPKIAPGSLQCSKAGCMTVYVCDGPPSRCPVCDSLPFPGDMYLFPVNHGAEEPPDCPECGERTQLSSTEVSSCGIRTHYHSVCSDKACAVNLHSIDHHDGMGPSSYDWDNGNRTESK